MDDIERLENEFHKDMLWIIEHEHEINLCSTRFRQMVERYHGSEIFRHLLKSNPESMFQLLRDKKRLNLCVEFYVVKDKYKPLFSDSDREVANWRLASAP